VQSIALAGDRALQDILRLLTLLFNHATISEVAGTSPPLASPYLVGSAFARRSHLLNLDILTQSLEKIKIDVWLTGT
jgi:hypothetical protein